jgi:thioredoxin reductase (NADPH)
MRHRGREGTIVAKPTILTVDDDRVVLAAVERDLRRQYGKDYRILGADSGAAALDALRQLQLRNDPVALFLADQRMPQMTGVEFLSQAIELFPTARRVLLTAYADTEAAIRAINDIRLDHYLMKPWDPPEERLYPVLSDLLADWQAQFRPAFEGIRVIGHQWSAQGHAIKDFLARNQVPYQWLDIEADTATGQLLTAAGATPASLPVVIFPDGSHLVQPPLAQVAEKVGLRTQARAPFYDLVIVGGGPAGLAAGVYGASEGLRTLIIEREAPGGQAGQSSRIENYLGFPVGLSGLDLARRAVAQATRFGTEILTPQEVRGARLNGRYKLLTLADGSEVSCHALLVATGVQYRKLDAPGVEALTGAGIYYGAAMTEALSTKGQDVFIVGAGNSAGQAAMYLSGFARQVTILVRGYGLAESMSQYLIDQIGATPNIAVQTRVSVTEAHGTTDTPSASGLRLASIVVTNADTDVSETCTAAALFIFIGAAPRTEWLDDLVERDRAGYIPTGPELKRDGKQPRGWNLGRDPYWLETSVPGIFAAGDVRARSVKRIASAVGEGSMAVQFVHQYLASA